MQKLIYKISLLLILCTWYSCGDNAQKSVITEASSTSVDDRIQISQEQFEQGKMELGTLKNIDFPITVSSTGIIDVPPENRAVVSALMGGYIRKTPLLIGDRVRKGQLLVTIENPEFIALQQRYMEVNGQLGYLKAEYDRQQTMVLENISSQKSFLKAESDYNTAVATYNGLRKQLTMLDISPDKVEKGTFSSLASIYSPIAGSVTMVHVSKGTYVSPATPIMEIINNDHIHLELSVFEKDIMNVKKGQAITFRIPEASSETFKAEVHLVGTSIDENRTIKVHGHLENEKGNFLTGMFVEAMIDTDVTKKESLPSNAIGIIDNQAYVLILDKKQEDMYYFKQIPVITSGEYQQMTALEHLSSFKPNAQFLVKGAFNLIGE